MATGSETDTVRDAWLRRLDDLVRNIRVWSEDLGWSTRVIEVQLNDSQLGKYKAPALLMQDDAVRLLLEPIARSAPGVKGVVDLYLMPSYDDVASLYFLDDSWRVHYPFDATTSQATISDDESPPLTKTLLSCVLTAMKKHAA